MLFQRQTKAIISFLLTNLLFVTCVFSQSNRPDENGYLEFVRIIGYLKNADQNLMFYVPSDILVDKDENIYVVDMGNYRVQKFNKDLEFLLSFGNKGRGPGEFLLMDQIGSTTNGEIIVSDARIFKFEVFDQTGNWLRQFRLENNPGSKFRLTKTNHMIPYAKMQTGILGADIKRDEEEALIKMYKDGKKVGEFGRKANTDNPFINAFANLFFIDVDDEDNIYVAYLHRNSIEKYSPSGDLLLRFERQHFREVPDITREQFDIFNANAMRAFLSRIPRTAIDIAVDRKKRIWLLTQNRFAKDEEKSYIDLSGFYGGLPNPRDNKSNNIVIDNTDMFDIELFGSDGVVLTKIRLNHFVSTIKIYENRLFIIDKYKSMQIYEYQILDIPK